MPEPGQVSRLEARITRKVKGEPLKKRVRFYTGTHLKGQKVVLGTLWARRYRDLVYGISRDRSSTIKGPINIVDYDAWPSMLLEKPLPQCGFIEVIYEVDADRVVDLRCR